MSFIVKYNCTGCGHIWKTKNDRKGLTHSCPACDKRQKQIGVDWEAAHGTPYTPTDRNKSKAVDITYKMAETDYGMTDMKDNLREGDLAVKIPNVVGDAMQQGGGFYGADNKSVPQVLGGRSSAMEMARAAKSQRLSEKASDPIQSLQKSIKSSGAPSVIESTRRNPIARY